MSTPREPTGVTIHDPRTDELRTQAAWTVVDDDGSLRTLRLRVARGVLDGPVESPSADDNDPRAA